MNELCDRLEREHNMIILTPEHLDAAIDAALTGADRKGVENG